MSRNSLAREHARRLLAWLQTEAGYPELARGRPAVVPLAEVRFAYEYMTGEYGLDERPWQTVGKHFNQLVGGKRSRNIVDPGTGLRTKKERICIIYPPAPQRLRPARKPRCTRPAPTPAPTPANEYRRAA